MLVLIRRMKSERQDDFEWEDEFEDEDDEAHLQHETTEEFSTHANEPTEPENREQEVTESKEDLRAKLAAEAKRTGVMQAAPGTEQGKTGWYIDSDGQLTSWLVSESGEWTRMS